jgi:sarcosine oxidase subunit beta
MVGKMVGLDLPIRPSKRHVFVTEPIFDQSNRLNNPHWSKPPMVIDFHNGFWFRKEGACLIFGMRNPNEIEGFSTSVDWSFFADSLAQAASNRLPILNDIGIMRAQAGLHSDTPDDMSILGKTPTIEGLYLACGFSGHGFMHSPAVGRLMAELVLQRQTSVPDLCQFSLDRFQRQAEQQETISI